MYRVTVQCPISKKIIPPFLKLKQWATFALQTQVDAAELTIRIVHPAEMRDLNYRYRKKEGLTNVLSFPFEVPAFLKNKICELGDIVICAEVVNREALEQNKIVEAHWAHMIIHGTLHLLGFDHQIDKDAVIMEGHEIEILNQLGFSNPYL